MNDFLEASRVYGARICFEITVKKVKSLRLGINEGEGVMLRNKKIDQADSLIFLGGIISEEGATTTDDSPQHQATRGQNSYVRSFFISIYSNPTPLHPSMKFPLPLNLSYDIFQPQPWTTCFLFSPR